MGAPKTLPTLEIPKAALSAPLAAIVSAIPWARRFVAGAITPVADGTAIASWPDSGGSGDPAVQATGGSQPAYKIGSNGINGKPVVRFTGSKYMATSSGAAAGFLSAFDSWYMYTLVKLTGLTGYPIALHFGSEVGGKRRALLYNQDQAAWQFNGQGADVTGPNQGTITTGTPYLIEAMSDGNYIWFWLNGVLKVIAETSPNARITALSGIITVGAANGGGSGFTGDIAEGGVLGRAITRAELIAVHSLLDSDYAMGFGSQPSLLTCPNGLLQPSGMSDNASLIYEGTTRFGTGDTLKLSGGQKANHSLRGITVLDAEGTKAGIHGLYSKVDAGNVAEVKNRNSNGFSAFAFQNSNGDECGAIGVANETALGTFKRTAQGTLFLEASGFGDPSNGGTFAFVQTNSAGTGIKLRYEFLHNGDMVFYDFGGVEIFRITQTGGFTFFPRATPPTDPHAGMVYYDSGSVSLQYYDGSEWIPISSEPDGSNFNGVIYVNGSVTPGAVTDATGTLAMTYFKGDLVSASMGS